MIYCQIKTKTICYVYRIFNGNIFTALLAEMFLFGFIKLLTLVIVRRNYEHIEKGIFCNNETVLIIDY